MHCNQRRAPSVVPVLSSSAISVKPADWNCTCGETNFASIDACRKCGAHKSGETQNIAQKVGDWICVVCNQLNFAHRRSCMSCKTVLALAGNAPPPLPVVSKPGDWNCACGEMNFASKRACRKCHSAKGQQQTQQQPQPAPFGAPPLQTQAEDDEEKNLCVVCMSSQAAAAITVCGHLALCLECAPKLRSCPMCRAAYTPDQILKIFQSGI